MATLDLINEALSKVDERVFYGTAAKLPKGTPWNYTVFSREPSRRTSGKTGFTDVYAVSVVREDFVPEEILGEVITAMEEIPGMRLSDETVDYEYDVKPGTTDTVELMVARFTKARKL